MGGITARMNGNDIDALIGHRGGKQQCSGGSQWPGRAECVCLVRAQLVEPPGRETATAEGEKHTLSSIRLIERCFYGSSQICRSVCVLMVCRKLCAGEDHRLRDGVLQMHE